MTKKGHRATSSEVTCVKLKRIAAETKDAVEKLFVRFALEPCAANFRLARNPGFERKTKRVTGSGLF